MNKAIIITYISFFMFSLNSFSQNKEKKLNKNVKVVNEYNPIISDANKINKMPSENNNLKPTKINFNYSIIPKSFFKNLGIDTISPAIINVNHKTVLNKSFLKAGLGNYSTFLGEIHYNILRSKKFALGLNAGHTSSNGYLKLEDKTKTNAPYHDTWASIYFRNFSKKYIFSLDANFLHNIYKYYGFQNINNNIMYKLPYGSNFKNYNGKELMSEPRQRLSSFYVNLGFDNKILGNKGIPFETNLKLGTFGNVTGINEYSLNLKGKMRYYLDNMHINLAGAVDNYIVKAPSTYQPIFYNMSNRDMTILTLKPSLGLNFNDFDLTIGINSYLQLGGAKDNNLKITPNLLANMNIEDEVILFAGVDGNYDINNYEKIQRENYFVSADSKVENSFTGVHIFGGIKGNLAASAKFTARFDYSFFSDQHFFTNRMIEASFDKNIYSQSNVFDVLYDDGKLLSVSGEVKFNPSKNLDFTINGKYNNWKLDKNTKAWYKPEYEIGTYANYSFSEYLKFNVGINIIGKRYALITGNDIVESYTKELKPIADLNIGANYQLTSKWHLFGKINNILASKYYMWNGYPSQRFNIRFGVGYSF